MTVPTGPPHLSLAQLAASGGGQTRPPATAHLHDCAACQGRRRDLIADGVSFLLTRCQPPPDLMDRVFEAIDSQPAPTPLPAPTPQPAPTPRTRPARSRHPRWPAFRGHHGTKRLALAAAAAVLLGGAGAGLATAFSPAGTGTAAEGGGNAIAHAGVSLTECARLQLHVVGGTLQSVSGSDLMLTAGGATLVTVTTSAGTEVLREVTGTVADITDGAHVLVTGTRTGTAIAAGLVAIMPDTGSAVPDTQAGATLELAYGTITDVRATGFTVVEGDGTSVPVTMSASSFVIKGVHASLGEFQAGEKTSVVGSEGPGGTLTAVAVEQGNLPAGALSALKELLPHPEGFPGAPGQPGSVRVLPTPPPAGSLPNSLPSAYAPLGSAWPGLLPYLLGGAGHPFASLGCDPSAITSVDLLALALGS
jgi:hypothetical protein